MQKVLSSRSRMEKLVSDIVLDFNVKPRLSSERGNALLVASSIYEACRYFELFQATELKGRCAVVTSYNPGTRDINTEDTGSNTETEKEFVYKIYTDLLGDKTALYKATVALIRAYANIAEAMEAAGYTEKEIADIKYQLDFYLKLREEIRKASGETLDLKTYEADMRHLIDNYIQADESKKISPFGDLTLIDIIVNTGIADAVNSLPEGIKGSKVAVAETIENNVRQKIIKEHLIDPAFFEEMSKLLDVIIKERKANAISYEEYLKKIAALAIHEKILTYRPDNWKGNETKERVIKSKLYEVLGDGKEVEKIFPVVKKQSEY